MIPPTDVLVCSPFPISSPQGNSVSARRIEQRIRAIGRSATAREGYEDEDASTMIALHARRSAPAIQRFKKLYPNRQLIIVLTGTDLYTDLPSGDQTVIESMQLADALVTYQDASIADIPEQFQHKSRTIWKSVDLPIPEHRPSPPDRPFTFTILAHLRETKDPFLPARALRLISESPAVSIRHFGKLLDTSLEAELLQHQAEEPRYHWEESLPRDRVAAAICSSHATINSGRTEGGSNAICESIILGTPVLATRTPANIGFLGSDYDGFYEVGDATALATAITACCSDNGRTLKSLAAQIQQRARLFQPENESAAWDQLLSDG